MKRDCSVVGIDIAKRVFHLVGLDERGKIVMRKRCSRGECSPCWLTWRLPPVGWKPAVALIIGRGACANQGMRSN
jgi:hypothetical protein